MSINKRNYLLFSALMLTIIFFACFSAPAAAAAKPKEIHLERNAIYYGEERELTVEVELSRKEYVYIFMETPGGRFLDDRGHEFREPVIFGIYGPGDNVRCRVSLDLFRLNTTGVYNLYAVQHRSRVADAEDLDIKTWEDLYDCSLRAALDVAGPYSAASSFVTLERQLAGRDAELSITFLAEGTGRMRGVPPYDTDGKQRLYIETNRSSVTACLKARAWDSGWVDVSAEVSGGTLSSGVNIFDLEWEDNRGRRFETIYTFDDGCIYINLTSDDSREVVFRAARDDRMLNLLRNGKQKVNFLQQELEEIFLDFDKYESRAGERFELAAYLWGKDIELEGVEVEFQERRNKGIWRTVGRADTNRYGTATRVVSRDVTGNYEYRAVALGKESNVAAKVIVAGAPFEIKLEKTSLNVVAGHEQKLRINYLDRYGNVIEEKTLGYLKQKPEDVMEIILVTPDRREINTTRLMNADKEGFYLRYDFPQEGIYQIEAFIAGTGISEICEVRSEKFGEASKLILETDKKNIRARERSLSEIRSALDRGEKVAEAAKITVTLHDDQDVSIKLGPDDLKLSLDKRYLGDFYYGEEIWFIAGSGISGKPEITVVHEDSEFMDSLTIAISGDPCYLDADVEIDGRRATVTLTYLDEDREPTAVLDENETSYTALLPEGLTMVRQEDFKEGDTEAFFVVEALHEQAYEVRVITDFGILEIVKIDFANLPARHVTLYIDSTLCQIDGKETSMDMAPPFISNGRTFVPVRFIAQTFGVAEEDINWEPKTGAVEKVVIPYENKLVTITIGSRNIFVLEDNEIDQVVCDEAPFIEDGRTVLPLRAIGELFGADFDWGPRTGATKWVSFTLF